MIFNIINYIFRYNKLIKIRKKYISKRILEFEKFRQNYVSLEQSMLIRKWYHNKKYCRICGSSELIPFETYIKNSYPFHSDKREYVACKECGRLQIVPRTDEYKYTTLNFDLDLRTAITQEWYHDRRTNEIHVKVDVIEKFEAEVLKKYIDNFDFVGYKYSVKKLSMSEMQDYINERKD